MFSKQPRISSWSSSTSATSLMHRLNIVDGSKPPPRLNKPISQTISVPTVATSPVTAEGSLTTPREGATGKSSKAEGKKKDWTIVLSNEMSPLPHEPLERAPVFITPPSSSIQFHPPHEQPDSGADTDTAFKLDVNANLQEAEETPRPSQFTRRGMEKGYSLSPMYNLWLEYCSEGESLKSTQSRVVFYATKPSLARDEVVDRGSDASTQHYMVHKPLLEQINRTVDKLQVFIQHMVGLIEERSTYFQVDPDDTLLKILGGAETTSQLHVAWIGLTSRLSAAQKFMLKYQQEYQHAPVPTSPVSTNPDIHKYIARLPDIDDKLRNIHGIIPRHVNKLPPDASHRLTKTKEKWESIMPAPPWLATPVQKSSSPISNIPARTSYKAASSFTLPDDIESATSTQKKQVSAPLKGLKVVQFAPRVDAFEQSQSLAVMSSGTPFKSAKGIFSQGEGSHPGPFPLMGPNRHISADNFLYGTDDIPAFSPDGMQFSGFSYPSNANATPSHPPAQPSTSTPWSAVPGPARSFHTILSQKHDGTAFSQSQGPLQARTQVITSRPNLESTASVR